jgi:hypothetical protein
MHMKNRVDQFKIKNKQPQATNNWKPTGNVQWRNPTCDPNAMYTSPGRMQARIVETEDFLPRGQDTNNK